MGDEGEESEKHIDRAEARLLVDIDDAKLRQFGTSGAAVRVDDLSRHGFRTEWPYPLKTGDKVWLTLPGIEPKPATVRWVRGFQVGCKFDTPFHPAVFDHLLKKLDAR